ncbi:MAG: hypothetical protein HQ503_03920 [Rhodospirillales bacterium]|nr:hypothetical protein [Rhodospirillales bacterium]
MKFAIALTILCAFTLGACSFYEKGEVVESSDKEIRIQIGYDAANRGVDTARQATEHCDDEDLKAVWYGHDKDGNLVYRCE